MSCSESKTIPQLFVVIAIAGSLPITGSAQTTGSSGTNGTDFSNVPFGAGPLNWGNYPETSVGGTGGAGIDASPGLALVLSYDLTGGTGGNGGNNTTAANVYGEGPAGAPGGVGGAGVAGSGFALTIDSTLRGGAGGVGGIGAGGVALGGVGGAGGAGGAGVAGDSFTLINNGTIVGGVGGAGGLGGSPGGASGASGGGGSGVVSYGNATITNAGTISGTGGSNAISLSGGGNHLSLLSASTTNGDIVSTSGATNGGDTIVLADDAHVNGNVSVLSGSAVVAGSSTITGDLQTGGSLTIQAGKTLNVGGNLISSGLFSTQVAGMTSYGRATVGGNVNLTGASLFVDASNAGGLVNGSLSNVISAGGAITGSFGSVQDNSFLFDFTPVYGARTFGLTVASSGNTVLSSVISTGNSAAQDVARVIDAAIVSDTNMSALFMPLTSQQQVSRAASQTLPLLAGGSVLASRSTLNAINDVVLNRVESQSGLSSGDDFHAERGLWLKPFGLRSDQSDADGVTGFMADSSGFVIGADAATNPLSRLGVAFAYAGSKVESNLDVAPQRDDVSAYQLIGYGSYRLDDRSEISFQSDFGLNKHRGLRQIPFASTSAASEYDSYTAHVGIGISRVFPVTSRTAVLPSIRADYTWIREQGYTERGAGILNLSVNRRTAQALIVSAGAKVVHQLDEQTALTAHLGLGYDTMNERVALTAAFAGLPGSTFMTEGIEPNPWLGRAGLGAVYRTRAGVELTGRYDVEFREGLLNQMASLKALWAF